MARGCRIVVQRLAGLHELLAVHDSSSLDDSFVFHLTGTIGNNLHFIAEIFGNEFLDLLLDFVDVTEVSSPTPLGSAGELAGEF